ncbi:MAG TPA: valine--tRNA ligase [Steroidobacteraceae bacterium]|nr:valine--tRNA ligase [Steroidobacteraceae bacterium]
MDKVYAPHDIERRIYERWESHGWFAPHGSGAPYCIMIPPPNVTGTLHMGHAFQHTLMDALSRYQRMRGRRVLWQPGTDHAGIATQMVVERQLNAQGIKRTDLSRAAFLERVWAWKEQSGGTIAAQMRRLGDSVDWSRDRFTMDPDMSRAVTEVFVRLYSAGLIYRGKRLVNWDPVLLTALSDLEVQSHEEDGQLWHLRYPLARGTGQVVVATTRPETLLGDTAVAVHPQDARYRSLVGQKVHLPLAGRDIPVIADEYVDPEFGSGVVKITPAHDFDDYELGLRHGLPLINIFTPRATLADTVPERFRGLDRFEARKRVVTELTAAGLIERIEKHRSVIPRGDRSGAVLEPYLTDQWYVKIAPLAQPAIAAVSEGRTRFVPESWARTYFEWMRNIRDWCVSRQLWWGHRIPAWYDERGNIYVARNDAEVRAQHGLGADVVLRQDEDVLDTWFSSALWPFSTLGWPEKSAPLATFYPTSVLITGFDIIFFWVARMMMMGLKFMGDVPFREVYITGLILDEHGDKMSKSRGNVIDPLDIVDGISLEELIAKRTSGLMQPQLAPAIEKATRRQYPQGISPHGTDALRLTFAALASPSREIRFELARVGGYRNFCNKLWNAARFVTQRIPAADASERGAGGTRGAGSAAQEQPLSVADRWIRSRFGRTLTVVESAFTEYRFDYVATALYKFTYDDYCDWYIELAKPVLEAEAGAAEAGAAPARRAAQRTLAQILEALQRALHPLMPFITEEIWLRVAPLAGIAGETVMLEAYPRAVDFPVDEEAEREIAWVQRVVLGVRQIRGEMNISPAKRIPLLLKDASTEDEAHLARHRTWLERLAGLGSITLLQPGAQMPQSAMALAGTLSVLVPMAGLIDPDAEAERLGRLLARAQTDLEKIRERLARESFVRNAPEPVVTLERERLAELERSVTGLAAQLDRVRGLKS